MLNMRLLTPRNILVIGAIAVAWHMLFMPIFGAVAGNNNDNS